MQGSIYAQCLDCLLESNIELKLNKVHQLYAQCHSCSDIDFSQTKVLSIDIPGRPEQPKLVDPRKVEKRSFSSSKGRLILVHSIAHIEFNAINLALDAAYRFQHMPQQFTLDWLQVAKEEAEHFALVQQYLEQNDSFYGAYSAHNGLWDMVQKTAHNVTHRMALVPRVMEARGLDVTPKMMERFKALGDQQVVDILTIIYQQEIGHVAIGNTWYQYCCDVEQKDAQQLFKQLISQYFLGKLRGPFNIEARTQAGFSVDELEQLEGLL